MNVQQETLIIRKLREENERLRAALLAASSEIPDITRAIHYEKIAKG